MIPGQVSFQITEEKINCTIYANDMADPQHNQIHEIMRCFITCCTHLESLFHLALPNVSRK